MMVVSSICVLSLRRLFLALLMCLVAASAAHAIAVSNCRDHFAFHDADVNVVVLPYFQEGVADIDLNPTGGQLSYLLKLEIVFRAMQFDRWGVILLTGDRKDCQPDELAERLLRTDIPPGGRLILLWGKMYEDGADIYVQSYLRFFHKPLVGESSPLMPYSLSIAGKLFVGDITSRSLAFPPERMTHEELSTIESNFRASAYFYSAPDTKSSRHPVPLDDFMKCMKCGDPLAFSVEGREGDWIAIRTRTGEREYLLAHTEQGMSLDSRLPEVGFIQGLFGYLRYHLSSRDDSKSYRTAIEIADRALSQYALRNEASREAETRAVALQLSGILENSLGRFGASEKLDTAFQLVPYNSDARNLAAIGKLNQNFQSTGSRLRPQETVNDFIAAVALDPDNSLVLANIQSFYELLSTPLALQKVEPEFAIPAKDLQQRLKQIIAIRQNLAAR